MTAIPLRLNLRLNSPPNLSLCLRLRSPLRMAIEIIRAEFPGERWCRERQEFREANRQRIHDQLIGYVVKTSQPAGEIVGEPQTLDKYYKYDLLPETHAMSACED